MRPPQWIKNLVVFAGLIFDRKFTEPKYVIETFIAFGIFCLVSGGIYIINDVRDLEGDRRHPTKSKRPLASGQIPVPTALGFAFGVIALGLGAALAIDLRFASVVICYVLTSIAYSISLKHIVIIDVMILAFGFVLRAIGGSWILGALFGLEGTEPSQWLLICSFLLALFLGFGKRRHELVLMNNAHEHREILKEYSPYFLDQMMGIVTTATLVAYAGYTMDERTEMVVGTDKLVLTIPFVLYGIFRYLYLVHQKEKGGNPTRIMLTDRPILAAIVLWVVAVMAILYFDRLPTP